MGGRLCRLDLIGETGAIYWKRRTEKGILSQGYLLTDLPNQFTMSGLILAYTPVRPSISSVLGVYKQTHLFTDLQLFYQNIVCRSLRLNEVFS